MGEEKKIEYIAFESTCTRLERMNKRLWVLCIILIVLLFCSNLAWVLYESQYQTVESTTVTQDLEATDGGDAIINDGVHINGENKTDSK